MIHDPLDAVILFGNVMSQLAELCISKSVRDDGDQGVGHDAAGVKPARQEFAERTMFGRYLLVAEAVSRVELV